MNYRSYYEHPAVRERIRDFLGRPEPTCLFLDVRESGEARSRRVGPEGLEEALERGCEVERSLWDRESLVAHLDLEYVNFDFPLLPYLDPERAFRVQGPVVRAVEAVLLEDGLAPLHLLSGRGHHFAWRVPRGSPPWKRLVHLGREWVSPSLRKLYAHHDPRVGKEAGAAYAGLGLLMEMVAHRVLARAAPECAVPLMVTAVKVGPGERGREIVSLDLSEYGDPLHCRTVRVPFGAYLKADYLADGGVLGALPRMVVVPLHEMAEAEGIRLMRDLDRAADLAGRSPTAIPDVSSGMTALLERYEGSSLRTFHEAFLQGGDPEREPDGPLPRCVREALAQPNDRLLKPAVMQLVVRVLMAEGFHPREAAGVILRRFEADHGWLPDVHFCDAATRATFYTRLFAGLVAEGRDDLVDFNCCSTQEKGDCPADECASNLARTRDRLLERRRHGRLAGGAFHRMLL